MQMYECRIKFVVDMYNEIGYGDSPSDAADNALERLATRIQTNPETFIDDGLVVVVCRRGWK